jgi:Arc/MetJ-type ribon-helix-helix transcriptional regulator
MNIHLSKDHERFVQAAVKSGRYATEDDVVNDAIVRLRQAWPEKPLTPGRLIRRAKLSKPLTEAELRQHMLKIGLMSQLPDVDADFDDPDDQPVTIKGEPLSETIIRERR